MTPTNRKELRELIAAAMWDDIHDRGSYATHADSAPDTKAIYQSNADAILTALDQSGCEVVPIEATEGMLDATMQDDGSVLLPWRYTAMLSASPYRRQDV